MPHLLNRAEVPKGAIEEELSPIKVAIRTMEEKNKDLKAMIAAQKDDPSQSINPLTMALNGTIDAAVQGGTEMYRKAFFTPSFLAANPGAETEAMIAKLKTLMAAQVKILEVGMLVHGAQIPPNVRPLHEHLEETLAKLKARDDKPVVHITAAPSPGTALTSGAGVTRGRAYGQSLKTSPPATAASALASRPMSAISQNKANVSKAPEVSRSAKPQVSSANPFESKPVSSATVGGNPFDSSVSGKPTDFIVAAKETPPPVSRAHKPSVKGRHNPFPETTPASTPPPRPAKTVSVVSPPSAVNPFASAAPAVSAPPPRPISAKPGISPPKHANDNNPFNNPFHQVTQESPEKKPPAVKRRPVVSADKSVDSKA